MALKRSVPTLSISDKYFVKKILSAVVMVRPKNKPRPDSSTLLITLSETGLNPWFARYSKTSAAPEASKSPSIILPLGWEAMYWNLIFKL